VRQEADELIAEGGGGVEDGAGLEAAGEAVVGDGFETHGGDTAATGTVGVAAELAGGNGGAQVGGVDGGRTGEYAAFGRLGRRLQGLDEAARHVEPGIKLTQTEELSDDLIAFPGGGNLGQLVAALGSEDAHPDLLDVGVDRPELQELLQVAGAADHGGGDGAVDDDLVAGDVLVDALVGGGSAAHIVFGLQAVNGNHQLEVGQADPGLREDAEGAGDHLHERSHGQQAGDDDLHFAIADQGIAADDGNVERAMLADQADHAVD